MTRFSLCAFAFAAFLFAPAALFADMPAAVLAARDALSGTVGDIAAVLAVTMGAAELAAAVLFPGRNL